jgi:HTH-type transcriptional regulator/antitoxin HigA
MKTSRSKAKLGDLPKDYAALCRLYLPRPIRDRVDLDNVIEITDAMAGHKLTSDQEDYFDLLCRLIEDWEGERVHAPKITGLAALRQLVAEHGMSAADLARLLNVHRSLGAMILRGERQLTLAHVTSLARHFAVSADLFLPD